MDKRVMQHAEVLVDYSVKVKPKDNVLIRYEDYGRDLAEAAAELCSRRGALPMIYQVSTDFMKSVWGLTPKESLSRLPRHLYSAVKASDVLIQIRGEKDLTALKDIEKDRISLRSLATKPISDAQAKKRWVLTQSPCKSYAEKAGMSLTDYKHFVYNAVLRDWKVEKKRLRKVERLMNKTNEVRILGKDTDLTLSIEGRKAISDGGEKNMPGGEVFTTPVETSAKGHIYFDLPIIRMGNEARDIRLELSEGKVVDCKASVGQAFLKSQIETDEGSCRFGEFAIGMNNSITQFTKNILFDEKMFGTIHLAIGRGFRFCRGKNESAIHLDMIKKMADGGELYFDEKLVYKNGAFVA